MYFENRFSGLFRNRPFWGAVLFALAFYVFEEVHLDSPQGTYLAFSSGRPLPGYLAGILSTMAGFFLFFFFLWASFTATRKFRVLYALLFAAAVTGQYGYWNAFHRFMSTVDVHTALASSADLWSTSAGLFFDMWSVLPVGVYLVLLFAMPEPAAQGKVGKTFSGVLLAFIGMGTLIHYAPLALNPGPSVIRFFYTTTEAVFSNAHIPVREKVYVPVKNVPDNNIVLIIDESIRADHLSVNGYERPTTPYLETLAQRGNFHNWGIASSGATCSPLSNALLITGAPIDASSQEVIATKPTIFHYAKAMGYTTYYFDAQTNYLWNGLSTSDLEAVDHWVTASALGDELERDFAAAESIREIVGQSVGNFIVLNKRGVHFLYEHSYPADYGVWLPTPPDEDYRSYPELVVNAYDNGVLFNVNAFFEHLFPDEGAVTHNATYVIYTSDHGQTLFEGGVDWLHCNYTHQEATVPLILIGEVSQALDTTYPASHRNIFPTILDLMGVPDTARSMGYAPSLLRATSLDASDRYYFDGTLSIHNFDR